MKSGIALEQEKRAVKNVEKRKGGVRRRVFLQTAFLADEKWVKKKR